MSKTKYLVSEKEAKKIKNEMKTILKKVKKILVTAEKHRSKLDKMVGKDEERYHAPDEIIDIWQDISEIEFWIKHETSKVSDILFDDAQ
jgi:DNA-directed RNA polymerase sigma subunit (sigma70/sigma32)